MSCRSNVAITTINSRWSYDARAASSIFYLHNIKNNNNNNDIHSNLSNDAIIKLMTIIIIMSFTAATMTMTETVTEKVTVTVAVKATVKVM